MFRPGIQRWLICSVLVLSIGATAVMATVYLGHRREMQTTTYPFVAKRLFLEHPNDILINFSPLRQQLRDYVSASPEKIGLYFEYLPTGVNINVGANDEFFRASLVKLPIVMRAYKYIEEGKLSLDDELLVEEKQLDTKFGDFYKRGAGTRVSVRELISLILSQSDNTAFNVLYEKVNVQLRAGEANGEQSAADVYDYLDIPREASGVTPMITPKNFSSILKSLYFSAYLSLQHSNEILTLLSQPHSEDWMRRSIDPAVRVADKIGAYNIGMPELNVHSDCGIVYVPDRSYILCTMIRSPDTQTSIEHIRNISKMVFDYVKDVSAR